MKIIAIVLIVFLVIVALVMIESRREMNKYRITEYVISGSNASVPTGLRDKKIVFLSDYHEACDGRINDEIIAAIKKQKPDYILLGGDMLNGHLSLEGDPPSIGLINALANICPVYYAYGNHEKRVVLDYYNVGPLWEEYSGRLDRRVHFLINDKAYLNGIDSSGGVVYGLDIPLENYGRIVFPKLGNEEIREMIGTKPEGEFVILLGHAPDFFDGYSEWGADLVLSGHFHGGLIRFPLLGGLISPRLHLFPKYDYGLYKKNNSQMIVTGGLGQHSVKIRVNNRPEIVVIKFSN